MKNKKEAMTMMKKAMAMMEEENYPADAGEQESAELVQNAMDMGMQSPNAPNGEDDAAAKDQGGFVSQKVANGQGQSEEQKRALRKQMFIASMKKG